MNGHLPEKKILERCDINKDGCIDKKDLVLFDTHYGYFKGESRYIECLDINLDGIIDMRDIALIAINLGKSI